MSHTLVLNADWTPISVYPMSHLSWNEVIPKVFEDKVRVLHEYENWVVRSPSCSIRVPSVVLASQYVNVQRFAGYTDDVIKLRDDYTCQYCLKRFKPVDLTMDHVIPESHGGLRRVDNLVAACGPCNLKRGNNTAIQPHRQPWRPTRFEIIALLRKYPITVPHESWIDYIGWPTDLVRIQQPIGQPGYRPLAIVKAEAHDEAAAIAK